MFVFLCQPKKETNICLYPFFCDEHFFGEQFASEHANICSLKKGAGAALCSRERTFVLIIFGRTFVRVKGAPRHTRRRCRSYALIFFIYYYSSPLLVYHILGAVVKCFWRSFSKKFLKKLLTDPGVSWYNYNVK